MARLTMSEIVHEALVEAKKARESMTPGTFGFTLATDVMKELADLELRTFNQEMDTGTG